MAFKDYNIFRGSNPIHAIALSPWVGLKHFKNWWQARSFQQGAGQYVDHQWHEDHLAVPHPHPVRDDAQRDPPRTGSNGRCRRPSISPTFFPGSSSFGIFYSLLGSYGIVNTLLVASGAGGYGFFTDQKIFRGVLVFTEGLERDRVQYRDLPGGDNKH